MLTRVLICMLYADDEMVQLMDEAKKDGYTMKVRHAKILFCGASGAGKTSFVRFLKNEKFSSLYHSTGLGNTHQIMISRKATIQGTKWVDLNPVEELHQLKLRLHYKQLTKPITHHSKDEEIGYDIDTKPMAASFEDCRLTDLQQLQPKKHKVLTKTPPRVTVEERLCSKSPNLTKNYEEPLPVWDILTLLDTGGQPQFINMLPAVNTSATVTFVVLNMLHVLGAKGFDERVQVHHYREGVRYYEPYPLNYTNKDLIKCLTALLNDSIVKDVPLPGVLPVKTSDDDDEDYKSHLCFVGTHLDKVKGEDVDKVDKDVQHLIAQLEPIDSVSVWSYKKKTLFAVDNTMAGKEDHVDGTINVDQIRSKIKAIMDSKAIYEVPITWMILEMEIRHICGKQRSKFMTIPDALKVYKKLIPDCDDESAELQVKAALRFHHMFGILLYFHEVPGMNNFVICNPQWLFTNLTNFVCCSFDETIVDRKALNILETKGILNKSLIGKINTESLGGIKLDFFLELLKYLNIITPYPKNDSSDYLMLAILDSYKDEESDLLKCMPPINGVEFVIQFNSGTFPRGVFCCLVVQLVQRAESWNLQVELQGKRCIYSNFVAFCAASGQYILLLDKISHLEIQVTQSQYEEESKSIHFDVQQTVITALKQISTQSCNTTELKCGFYCKNKPCLVYLQSDHMARRKPLPRGLHCENHGLTELKSHKLWCENPRASKVWYLFLFMFTYLSEPFLCFS